MATSTSSGLRRRRPTRFFVFTSPRSGSSWLVDLLDSHPRIAAYAELFLPGDRTVPTYGNLDLPRFETTLAPRRRLSLVPARIGYLNRLYATRPGVDAVGFKLMYGHPRVHPGVLASLTLRRARAIHLIRSNTLDQIVSRETAQARGLFRAHEGEDVRPVAVRVDTRGLVDRLRTMEDAVDDARKTLRRRQIATLEVVYERLRESPENELDRILPFLDVERSAWSPASSLVRMNTGALADVVENLAEVAAALAGTRFAWMLERELGVRV